METTFSDLPDGIIDVILNKIRYIEDFVRFGAACKSLQSVMKFRQKTQTRKISFSPWVMLATYDDNDHHKGGIQKFFSLTSERIFNLQLPQTQGKRCFGTSFGWIVTIDIDLNISLLDPFTQNRLSLPPQSTFEKQYPCGVSPSYLRKFFVRKFMGIQTGPDQSSCVVMAIHSEPACISFARPGDTAWKLVEDTSRQCYKDIILYDSKFYAIASELYIQVIDISDIDHPKAVDFVAPPENDETAELNYLVEMNGRLHFVERFTYPSDPGEPGYATDCFSVYEFDFSTRKWSYLYHLGQYALFLGINTSYAVDVREFPKLKPNCVYYTDDREFPKLKPNCVYYTDDFYCEVCDMGVYHYRQGETENIYCKDNILSEFSRPIFVKPCL